VVVLVVVGVGLGSLKNALPVPCQARFIKPCFSSLFSVCVFGSVSGEVCVAFGCFLGSLWGSLWHPF
jgi:hypothetical protein